MRTPDRGFDNWRQPVGQTASAVSGLPAGRAKRVNPSRCYMQHRAVFMSGGANAYPTYKIQTRPRPVGLTSAAPSGVFTKCNTVQSGNVGWR